jgi:rubredoxin
VVLNASSENSWHDSAISLAVTVNAQKWNLLQCRLVGSSHIGPSRKPQCPSADEDIKQNVVCPHSGLRRSHRKKKREGWSMQQAHRPLRLAIHESVKPTQKTDTSGYWGWANSRPCQQYCCAVNSIKADELGVCEGKRISGLVHFVQNCKKPIHLKWQTSAQKGDFLKQDFRKAWIGVLRGQRRNWTENTVLWLNSWRRAYQMLFRNQAHKLRFLTQKMPKRFSQGYRGYHKSLLCEI